MKNKLFVKIILTVAVTISTALLCNAQTCPGSSGCLDLTFGSGGTALTYVPVTTPLNPAEGVIQNDGKILALVNVLPGSSITDVIIRYNPNGTVDSTFGNGGIVSMNWTGANNTTGHAYVIALQTVGTEERIIVAGTGTGFSSSLRVERYLSDGTLDTTFGSSGTVILSLGAAEAIAVQPDGKILTMGTYGALIRLNSNGTLDTTFGSGGFIKNSTWKVQSIALQSNGRIVAAGYWTNNKGVNFMSAWRFNTNGSLDDGGRADLTKSDSFGKSGQMTIDFLGSAIGWDVKIDSNGKIVLAGANSKDFAVARLTTTGQLDTTFGSNGTATIDFSGLGDQARNVELRSDGQMVMVGYTMTTSTNRDTGVVRLNSNGSLDTTFGQGGKVISDFSSEGEFTSYGMSQFDAVCGCEKIIAVGTVKTGGTYYAIAARYLQ